MSNSGDTHSYGEEGRLLLELSRHVSSSLDLQEVLDESLAGLRRLIEFEGGSIQLIVDGAALQCFAADPPAPPEVYEFKLPLGTSLGGRCALTGEPIYTADALIDARTHQEGRKKAATPGVRSYFAAPLIQQGAAIGIVQIDSSKVDAFSERDQATLLAFVPTIAAAVQNARLFEREMQTLNELREAERLKADFLSVVSHELRTPLASLLGLSETLAARIDALPAATIADVAQRIAVSGKRLKRVIEDVLDISTIERGQLHVEPSLIDIAPVIQALLTSPEDPPHPLFIDIEESLPPVWADADRLTQIAENLVVNAQKFSPEGSPIEVRVSRADDRVALTVTDHGRGIPQNLHERVFERFFQVEPATTRTVGGMGVGLYLVKHLCELMDAQISLSSTSDQGSRFTVLLCISEQRSDEIESRPGEVAASRAP